jgi:hypothetical protein
MFHKILGNSWVAAQLTASQAGLSSMSDWVAVRLNKTMIVWIYILHCQPNLFTHPAEKKNVRCANFRFQGYKQRHISLSNKSKWISTYAKLFSFLLPARPTTYPPYFSTGNEVYWRAKMWTSTTRRTFMQGFQEKYSILFVISCTRLKNTILRFIRLHSVTWLGKCIFLTYCFFIFALILHYFLMARK